MANRITIDPITRIEGHLRIDCEVDGGKVTKAWASGQMWRGVEQILLGRDPRDAWAITQRICGVCTTVHAIVSVRAVENALKMEIPLNAQLIRNIIITAHAIHDHIVHFYHLSALDWVDVVSALKADPKKTAALAESLSTWKLNGPHEMKAVQDRLKNYVQTGQLGIFTNGYWGHPAMKLSPEVNLLAVAHYLEALDWQRDVIRLHAVLGGKNPHPQTYLVGGMAAAVDPNTPEVINLERIAFMRARVATMRAFVEQVYLPDLKAVARFYPDWFELGAGHRNYLAYGDVPSGSINDPSGFAFPRGVILNGDLGTVHPLDEANVTESIARSYYDYSGGNGEVRHPFAGETTPISRSGWSN